MNAYLANLMQGANFGGSQPLGRSVGPTSIMAQAAPSGGTWRQGLTGAAPMPRMPAMAHSSLSQDWLNAALDRAFSRNLAPGTDDEAGADVWT